MFPPAKPPKEQSAMRALLSSLGKGKSERTHPWRGVAELDNTKRLNASFALDSGVKIEFHDY